MMNILTKTLLILLLAHPLLAAQKTGKKGAPDTPSTKNLKLETDVEFKGGTVLGQYANSSEVNADVEQEKSLINVVEPRENFKFQLVKSKEWN